MSAIMETEPNTYEESTGELSTVSPSVPSVPLGMDPGDDIVSLGNRLGAELNSGYMWYRRWQEERSGEKATPEVHRQAVKTAPSTSLGWQDFSMVAEADAEEGALLWERIRREARRDLRSGHLAAQSCEVEYDRPIQRARFLEIRSALIESWQPQNGMEIILIDQMTAAYAQQLHWTEEYSRRSRETAAEIQEDITYRRQSESHGFRYGSWMPPKQREADAIEQAFLMADKWNRIFLRVLRQLRDLRRLCPPVIINNGGQVNVGQQQVNTATAGTRGKKRRVVRRSARSTIAG